MRLKQMEAEHVSIAGMDFHIYPFPAFKAANISGEIATVLSPVLGALLPLISGAKEGQEDNGDDSLLDLDAKKAAAAIMQCNSLNGDRMEQLMRKLLLGGHIVVETEDERGEIRPQKLNADLTDEIFCGRVQDMFAVCFHVIRINYNGFFRKPGGPSGKAGPSKEKMQRPILGGMEDLITAVSAK